MSRSQPTLQNPATRFFEWKGQEGHLEFYDKEQQKRITVPLPFTFLPLDELSTIVGYSKRDESGYWSNEVKNVTKDQFIVRTKHGIAEQGLYSELANSRSKGAKYAKSIYLAYQTKQGWEIGNFKAHGSALSAWIEFSKTCKPENGKVTITRGEAQDAPTGQFFPPVYTYASSELDEDTEAMKLDRELQIYLEQYLKHPPVTDFEDEIVNGSQDDITTDSVVQPSRSQTEPQSGYEKAKTVAEKLKRDDKREDDALRDLMQNPPYGDDEVDLSDVPF